MNQNKRIKRIPHCCYQQWQRCVWQHELKERNTKQSLKMLAKQDYCSRDECSCRLCIERERLRLVEAEAYRQQQLDKYVLDHHHPSWYVNGLCCCDYCNTGRRAFDLVAESKVSISDENITTDEDTYASLEDRKQISLQYDKYVKKWSNDNA